MAGIQAGKTWSRIGAEVAPTSSAAPGVWDQSLLEWVLPGYHRDPDNHEWVKT